MRHIYGLGQNGQTQGGSVEGDIANKTIMDNYLDDWLTDTQIARQGPLLPSGKFDPNGNDNGAEAPPPERKGSETLEQVAIWGTVGILGYFLIGPMIGLKK